ncbi:hypothetical protein DFH09DRAFT_1277881 [Mycena vulgaris]|nr:hypothetical protein DFH09DRAFT_1277881 [Mycena vulgaris]
MFILPAYAQDLPAAPARLRLFPAATLALTLLAALLVLAFVRSAVAARRRLALPLSAKAMPVQVQEKSSPKTTTKPASSWIPLRLSWETLSPPPASASASPLPRAGPVRRPEPALASRPRVEAPHLPPSLLIPTSRLGLLAARAPAGCERERLSTAAAIPSGSARERMREAKRCGGASTPPPPTSSQRPSSPGATRTPCARHTPTRFPSLASSSQARPPARAADPAPPHVRNASSHRPSTSARPHHGSVAFSPSRGSVSVCVLMPGRCVISLRRRMTNEPGTTLRID